MLLKVFRVLKKCEMFGLASFSNCFTSSSEKKQERKVVEKKRGVFHTDCYSCMHILFGGSEFNLLQLINLAAAASKPPTHVPMSNTAAKKDA